MGATCAFLVFIADNSFGCTLFDSQFSESYFFRVGWLTDVPATASQVLRIWARATKPSSSELKGLTVVEEKELALQIPS